MNLKSSQTNRKTFLDQKNKFNQVFTQLQTQQFYDLNCQINTSSQNIYQNTRKTSENQTTPTFGTLTSANSPDYISSPSQDFSANLLTDSKQPKIGVFMLETSNAFDEGPNSQHEQTYIDKLNDEDQVIMPFSQEQLKSLTELQNLSDQNGYDIEIQVESQKDQNESLVGDVSIGEVDEGDDWLRCTNFGDVHQRNRKAETTRNNLGAQKIFQLDEMKPLQMEQEMTQRENGELSSKIEKRIAKVQRQIGSETVLSPDQKAQQNLFSKKIILKKSFFEDDEDEMINIDIVSDDEQEKSQKNSEINSSFQGIKMIGQALDRIYDDDYTIELKKSKKKVKLDQSAKSGESESVIPDQFYQDIRKAHLGVGKSRNSGIPTIKGPKQGQVSSPSNDESIFESLEVSTVYFDCQIMNSSNSFTSNQNMLSQSVLVNSKYQPNNLGNDHFNYRGAIFEDAEEDQEDILPALQSPGKNQKARADSKSYEYLKLSDEDLKNLEQQNQSSHSISIPSPKSSKRKDKMRIINNMTGIFVELLHEYKTHFSQFVYTVQEELFSFKQSFVEERELLFSQIEKHLEFVRHQLKIKIRQEVQKEYDIRLKQKLAGVEEELFVRQEEWKRETIKRIQEDLIQEYEERYQNMIVGANRLPFFNPQNQYDDSQSQVSESVSQEDSRGEDQILESYLNKQQRAESSNNILPAEISMFATTNDLNDNFINASCVQISAKRNSQMMKKQSKNSMIKRESRRNKQRQMESILQELEMQNESLCEELMIQQSHTQILNEQQLKYQKQVKKLNQLEDELEELKKENIYLKSYLFQLEEEKQELRKLYEGELGKGSQASSKKLRELEQEIKSLYEGSQELKEMNLKLEMTISMFKEELIKHKEELRASKSEILKLKDQLSDLKQAYSKVQTDLASSKHQNSKLEIEKSTFSTQTKTLVQKNASLEAEIARLNLFIRDFNLRIIHYEELQKIAKLSPPSEHQQATQSFSHSNLRLSRASSQGSLINPVLSQHCLNSNNSIVNQILQNMRNRKSKLFSTQQNVASISNQEKRDVSLVKSTPSSNMDQGDSEIFMVENGEFRKYNYGSQQEIAFESGNLSKVSNLNKMPQNMHIAKSYLKESNFKPGPYHNKGLIGQEALPCYSPKSPSSSSIVSKKISSSQKDKKMSIISLKLEKLRSDIKQEIKEISSITK